MSLHLFLVSADSTLCALSAQAVTGLPIQLQTARSLAQAQPLLPAHLPDPPLLLLIDLRDTSPSEAARWMDRAAPAARTFLIAPTADGQRPADALERGGFGGERWLARPTDVRQMADLLTHILGEAGSPDATAPLGVEALVGRSIAFRSALDQALRAATTAEPVLLLGERGTGKRLFARAIHGESARSEQPFDCLEGAAVTAETLRPGSPLLRSVQGGTLYLCDLVHLDRPAQRRILERIDQTRLARLQGVHGGDSDLRWVFGTEKDLEAAVRAGRVDPDLRDRLVAGAIRIPPLRERPSDILLMAEHFLARAARGLGQPLPRLTPAAKEALVGYAWPGNVRELSGALQLAMLQAPAGGEIDLDRLPLPSMRLAAVPATTPPAASTVEGPPSVSEEVSCAVRFCEGRVLIDLPAEGIAFDEVERALLNAALQRTRGNVVRAAKFLRLGRGSLRYRLEKHGIVQPQRRRAARRRPVVSEESLPKAS